MALVPFETAHAHDYPTVRQLSVFIENRVGQLLRLTRLLDRTEIHILAISVVNSIDCAIIRMIVDEPDDAVAVFREGGFKVSETELIVVSLPPGKRALLHTWMALLAGEVNIGYTYPLMVQPRSAPALAVQVDETDTAIDLLRAKKFVVLDQSDLLEHPL
ncbi:MAG: acetolactate synthase [Planctomycetes bacterium]|nr:acetolactate synthase [Planctomycetota bacterium]